MKDNSSLGHHDQKVSRGLQVSRREFIKITGSGIVVFFAFGDTLLPQTEAWGRESLPKDFNAFLKIAEDGRVSCFTGKIEMGQGIVTSLAQMLADELDVSLESVDMVMGDTDLCPWDMGTFGSMSTRFFGPPLRAAGAEARHVLLQLASEHLKIPIPQLSVEKGVIFDTNNKNRQVSYGQLARGKKIERHIKQDLDLKKPHQFKIMNRSITRRDALEKVTGKAKYAGDIQIPGMLYAKILRPPAHGARLVDVDLLRAKEVTGVEVVRNGDFIAVLHEYPDVAEMALDRIKATFDKLVSDVDDKTIFKHLLKTAPAGEAVSSAGDLKQGEKESISIFEQTYLDGYVAHAPIEPHTAIVHIEGKKATVWDSSQTPFRVKQDVARELGFREDKVRVISPYVGGGFGGKTRNPEVLEAARLAKLTGRPVQVAWSRAEEFFYDSFRPAAVVKIKSGITDKGRIGLWDYHVYFAGQMGSEHFYNIPHHRTTTYGSGWGTRPGTHPFATGAWRAPANNTNTFARESQIDIMAAGAGIDPLEFRLQNLTDEKMHRVLQAAAKAFGWNPGRAPSGRGHGIACGIYAGTYVATMAEVDVARETGQVKVKRVVCAQDMGLAINPEGAVIQMEGCITMGLGYALKEDIHFKGGEIFEKNFDTYEIPRFSWLPEIETIIIDNKNANPQGGGEPAIITMGGVIANAIYDAVDSRVFQLPMSPERIKDAMKKA